MTKQQSGSPAPLATAPQLPDPEPVSDTQQSSLPLYAAILGGVALGLFLVGAISNITRIKTPLEGAYQWSARLNHLWPETAEARAGCQVLGGVPTWSPRGLSIFTPEGGWCGYMKAEGAWHLYGSHYGSTVKHSFPGRELPDPIQR